MYRNQLKLALIRQAVVSNVIKDKSALDDPETGATRAYSEILSRLNRKSRRLTLLYLLKRRDARRAGRPFKQHILEFFEQYNRARRKKRVLAHRAKLAPLSRNLRKGRSK